MNISNSISYFDITFFSSKRKLINLFRSFVKWTNSLYNDSITYVYRSNRKKNFWKKKKKTLTSGSCERLERCVHRDSRCNLRAVGSKNHVSGRVCAAETQDGRRSMARPRVRVRTKEFPRDVRIKERGRRAREIETRGRVARARARDHESIAAIR